MFFAINAHKRHCVDLETANQHRQLQNLIKVSSSLSMSSDASKRNKNSREHIVERRGQSQHVLHCTVLEGNVFCDGRRVLFRMGEHFPLSQHAATEVRIS